MNAVYRITAARRDMAHEALQEASRHLQAAMRDTDLEWKRFWKDAARDSVEHAKTLRLHGIEYPQIP